MKLAIKKILVLSYYHLWIAGGGHRPHQLLVEDLGLVRQIIFVCASDTDIENVSKWYANDIYKNLSLYVLSGNCLRCLKPFSENEYNSFSSLEELTATFKPDYIRAHNPVDLYLGYLEFINKKNIPFIYDQMDYWEAFSVQPWGDKYVEEQYIQSATHITTISQYLINLLPKEKPKLLLENAVSNQFIQRIEESKHEKVINNNSKNVLYIGAIWPSWFDWDLSIYLVRKFPKYNFTFIGAVTSTIDENDGVDTVKLAEELGSHSNVTMLPEILHTDLAQWLIKSDVGIIPFKVNELTLACSPLKVFEYLAAGLPVVSPNLTQITGYPQVYTGNNFDEIAQSLAKAHKQNIAEKDKADMDKFRQSNTWQHRLNALDYFIGAL
ncbi:glycosyltransferase [Rickettsiella endosymbiont of Miltochrista miniata]|uniref:glycosyltransferase n=1 Tax=Rickettsiella endosymbiont of Miltochrista miniata TaxID=3066239 RepID=UPI00313D5A6B